MSEDKGVDTRRYGKHTHNIRLAEGDGPYEHHHEKWPLLVQQVGGFPNQFLRGVHKLFRSGVLNAKAICVCRAKCG